MVNFHLFPTQIGDCGIAWQDEIVVATELPDKTRAMTSARLAAIPGASEGDPPDHILSIISSITSLLDGEKTDLSFINCDFSRVDPFEAKVYALARTIPPGETLTYGDIASELGDKQLSRVVGRALGRNPFPIIVPCHRVIGANNKLTGFSAYGGIETKQKMLSIERGGVGETMGLFDDLT